MSGDLRVTTAHVRELAAKQGQAAAEITAATEVVEGVDTAVRWTHGVIAASTAAAVQAAQHQRRSAGAAMGTVSSDLSDNLGRAAAQYDTVDHATGTRLGQEMRPR